MTTDTVSRPTPIARRTTLGATGGVLWVLSPVGWLIGDLRDLDPGTAAFAALLAFFTAANVVGPGLIAAGTSALGGPLGGGRALLTGVVLAAVGLTAVAVGNGIELTTLALAGSTSVVGYAVFYLGFLVALIGALLIGAVVIRRRRDPAARAGGWLLALAIPLGVGIGALFALLIPESDAGFAAAVAVPTGVGWLLLGRSLAATGRDPGTP